MSRQRLCQLLLIAGVVMVAPMSVAAAAPKGPATGAASPQPAVRNPLDPRGKIHMLIGIPDSVDTLKTYVEAEGNFSPGFGTYGVYFWLFDVSSGKLTAPTMDGVASERGLAQGGLPLPWTRWSAGEVVVTTEVAHVQRPSPAGMVHLAAARVTLAHRGRGEKKVRLYAALRPIGAAGFDVKSLAASAAGDALLADGHPALVATAPPTAAGASAVDNVGEFAFQGLLPPTKSASSEQGECSGAMCFDLTLPAGEAKAVGVICPVLPGRRAVAHQWDRTSGWFQGDLARPGGPEGRLQADPGLDFYRGLKVDSIFEQSLREWKGRLAGLSLQLPDPAWAYALTAINAHVAMAMNDGQPDAVAVNLNPFNRNAAYSVSMFQKAGLTDLAREIIDYMLAHPFSGRVQCEADNPGQLLWCLGQHWLYTRDRKWLERAYPSAVQVAAMIRYCRTTPPPHYVRAGTLEFGPALPVDRGDEKPADRRQVLQPGACDGYHPEYTEAFDIAGLRAAVLLARAMGKEADAAAWDHLAASLFDAYDKQFGQRLAKEYGSYAVLWPCRLYPLGNGKAHEQFRNVGAKKPGGWRYFPLATAHQGLLAGDRSASGGTVRLHLDHPQVKGWFVFDEGGKTGPGGWVHLLPPELARPRTAWDGGEGMPVDWSLSELSLLIRDCLLFEDQERLVLLGGIPPEWFKDKAGLVVRDAPTWFGKVGLEWRADEAGGRLTLSGNADPPGGYTLRLPEGLAVEVSADGTSLRAEANGDYLLPAKTRSAVVRFR